MFATLVFWHFLIDWVFQTHHEAMNKHKDSWIRARHCFVYAAGFVPYLAWRGWSWVQIAFGGAILFLSHFVEDSYFPVYLWAKYIRQVPGVRNIAGFGIWAGTALGKILMIGIDQIIHISFLWFLVWIDG